MHIFLSFQHFEHRLIPVEEFYSSLHREVKGQAQLQNSNLRAESDTVSRTSADNDLIQLNCVIIANRSGTSPERRKETYKNTFVATHANVYAEMFGEQKLRCVRMAQKCWWMRERKHSVMFIFDDFSQLKQYEKELLFLPSPQSYGNKKSTEQPFYCNRCYGCFCSVWL